MIILKSIYLYFFSVLQIIISKVRVFYFNTSFYDKKLFKTIPSRFFYIPSSHLILILLSNHNNFYKIDKTNLNEIWVKNILTNIEFNNLNNFLWLTKLDRKINKLIIQNIISGWIKEYNSYHTNAWNMENTSKRIISWLSNSDVIFGEIDEEYKNKIFLSITKQTNHLINNISNFKYDNEKILFCAAIILFGLVFKKEFFNKFKFGMKELEKTINIYFDKDGFTKSRNPEELYLSIKYFIIIKEWIKEAQENVPYFLDNIIIKSGNCYKFLSNSSKKIPLFNGTTECDYQNFDTYIKNLKYKFEDKKKEISGFVKIKRKKIELFMDIGNAPTNRFIKNYQSGCLSFELISNGEKLICNSGYAKHHPANISLLSCSTAAHSTLSLNNTSINSFYKNSLIRKKYGNCLVTSHKILDKTMQENDEQFFISASHNGYDKKIHYLHKRSINILKKEDKIIGIDELRRTKSFSNSISYSIRFHIYPGVKIAKTQEGKTILISLKNGEGWIFKSEKNNLDIEKNIFFANKSKFLNNECILISGSTNEKNIFINWKIERIN